MRGPHAPFLVLSLLALFATGCGHQPSSPPKSEASKPGQNRLTEVIELPQQLLTFEPSRDDITVGCAIFSFEQSLVAETNLDAVRLSGSKPDDDSIYLKQVGKNQFELPELKLEFSSKELGGPLHLTIKIYFNELTNQYDSQFYEKVPDRYAILTYCTKEDEDPSNVNPRLGANRVKTLKEFKESLAKPFLIKLNKQPLVAEWGHYPSLSVGDRLNAHEIEAVEQTLRDKGEQNLISISAPDSDHARVFVGDGTYFRAARVYTVVRSGGAWQVESVKSVKH